MESMLAYRAFHPELADKVACPHCGSTELTVSGKVDYTVGFELGFDPRGERRFSAHRELGDSTVRQRVRCASCGRVAYSRRDLEGAGWPVPW